MTEDTAREVAKLRRTILAVVAVLVLAVAAWLAFSAASDNGRQDGRDQVDCVNENIRLGLDRDC